MIGSDYHAELEAIYIDQRDQAISLQGILQEERTALHDGDVAELEQLTSSKTLHLEELDKLRGRELALLSNQQSGRADDSNPPHELNHRRMEALKALGECHRLNMRNGLLLQSRIGFVRRALDVLGNLEGTPRLYGSDGQMETGRQSRLMARG